MRASTVILLAAACGGSPSWVPLPPPLPESLQATTTEATLGELMDIEASGAAPGEWVHVLAAPGPGSTCLPALGGLCVGLDRSIYLGTVRASTTGQAILTLPVPATVPFDEVCVQVVARRGARGIDSVGSNVVCTPVVDPDACTAIPWYPDLDGDGFGETSAATTACLAPDAQHVDLGGDCDDSHDARYPGALEIPADGIDQDCDGADLPLTGELYRNDFSHPDDSHRIDQFVAYRDPFVVNHTVGASDHASTGGIDCTAPEMTRPQSHDDPASQVYPCFPGGNPAAGHQMAFAMDTSGYGFVGALPDQVFEGLTEVSVHINTTSADSRNFVEIKVVPANDVYVNAMPCVPDLPCNDGWDYDDIGAVGASTNAQEGTGMRIATAAEPDGYAFDRYNVTALPNGDESYAPCGSGYCFKAVEHEGNIGIRERYQHLFRDNQDGTLSLGIERDDGTFGWVTAPGSFPAGPVRVVIAFHNYTGTKDGAGPGYDGNLSPSEGGFTWHWDDLAIQAATSTPSETWFGGHDPERIVVPDGCVAFAQGQRTVPGNRDIAPMFHCVGDPAIPRSL